MTGLKEGSKNMSPHTGPGRTDSYVKDSTHFVQRICKLDEEDAVSSIYRGRGLDPRPSDLCIPMEDLVRDGHVR